MQRKAKYYEKERLHARIPLYVRVEARGAAGPLGVLYSWNVSEGGLYLKAPDARAEDIPLGTKLSLTFSLPDGGPPLDVHAEVVWVDPAVQLWNTSVSRSVSSKRSACGE